MPDATIINVKNFQYAGRKPFSDQKLAGNPVKNYQEALLDAATRAAPLLYPTTLRKGHEVLRGMDRQGPNGPPELTIEKAREVNPKSSTRPYRWSGKMLLNCNRIVQHGALYVSEDVNALLNEKMRYSRAVHEEPKSIPWRGGRAEYFTFGPAKELPQLLATNVYYRYKLQHSIELLDLTPKGAAAFYSKIEADRAYIAAKNDMRIHEELAQVILNKFDYTATLPIGLSLLLADRTPGFRVQTAQAEIDLAEHGHGFNVVLDGTDGKPVSFLEKAGTLIVGLDGSRLSVIKSDCTDLTQSSGLILPGSLIDLPTGKKPGRDDR